MQRLSLLEVNLLAVTQLASNNFILVVATETNDYIQSDGSSNKGS